MKAGQRIAVIDNGFTLVGIEPTYGVRESSKAQRWRLGIQRYTIYDRAHPKQWEWASEENFIKGAAGDTTNGL